MTGTPLNVLGTGTKTSELFLCCFLLFFPATKVKKVQKLMTILFIRFLIVQYNFIYKKKTTSLNNILIIPQVKLIFINIFSIFDNTCTLHPLLSNTHTAYVVYKHPIHVYPLNIYFFALFVFFPN